MRVFLSRTCFLVLLFGGLAASGAAPSILADEIQTYFLMDREPEERPEHGQFVLHPELLPLWRKALAHPESELKRQAAEAVALAKHLGHDEARTAVPELLSVLTADKVHPAARHAAAHALIVLDSRSSARSLFEVSQKGGKDLRQLVEPALAEWDFEAIQPVWRRRIESVTTPRRDLMLAIQGLGRQRDAAALQGLLALVMKLEHPADIRLAAAHSDGLITDQGLESHAEQLLASGRESVLDRLCAVHLIARHRSGQAVKIQQALGADPEPTVSGEALRSLFSNDPELVLPLAESALQNPDANVRRVGIQTYIALPTVERIQTLAWQLNDPHPELRGLVRESFYSLSRDAALDPVIRQSSIAILGGTDWRGQEQAALLLGALDEESIAARLIELLDSERPEVMVTAAWSLKTIAVAATAQPVLEFAQRRTDAVTNPEFKVTSQIDDQLAHLFELLGKLKSVEATSLLQSYIPKTQTYGPNSRASAVWALGVILEGQTNESLAKQLMERVMDTMGLPPELFVVRRASVLTLGRIQAKAQLAGLKDLIGEQVDSELMDLTLRWAVLRITGEALPIVPPPQANRTGWFLEPSPRKN